MRRARKSSMFSLVSRPLSVALLLLGLFGLVWLRSSVTSAAYSIRGLEEKRSTEIKAMKSLLAERSKLMALSNIDHTGRSQAERKLVSGGYVFPDRVKVVHVTRSEGPEAFRASYRTGDRH
jgi:hypothetical protein